MRALVTGGTGYAGFHACLELAGRGHRVATISRDPDKPRARLLRRFEVEVIEASVAEPDDYREVLEASDVVIHTTMDFEDPQGADRALFDGLRRTPERRGGRRRLVYTTGCSIYGPRPEHVMDENTPGNPEHALHFRMELEGEAFALMPGTGVVVARPGFMYGFDGHSSQLAPWFAMGEAGEPVFRGDPTRGWSWVHVADLARAYALLAEADRGVDGEVFCLADERRESCVTLMRACLDAAGCDAESRFAEPSEDDVASTWFNQDEFITSAKARAMLGWAPRRTGVLDDVDRLYAAWRAAQDRNPRAQADQKAA